MMRRYPLILALLAAVFSGWPGPSRAITLDDPSAEFAFLDLESYGAWKGSSTLNQSQAQVQRIAGQMAFPAGSLWDRSMFGVFKVTYIERNIVSDGLQLNAGPLQRYWLNWGITPIKTPSHSGTFMAAVGLNSDMADVGPKDWNSEWVYIHSFTVNPNFGWGIGIDVQQYFIDRFMPYPLVFVDWRMSERTKLRWDADFLEVRGFLTPALSLTLGVRFNLEFFALKDDAGYEYNSYGAETGIQYALGKGFYLRFKYKELLGGTEIMYLPDGKRREEDILSGRSLRLGIAYGE